MVKIYMRNLRKYFLKRQNDISYDLAYEYEVLPLLFIRRKTSMDDYIQLRDP